MIHREISDSIIKDFNKGKIIIIVGARQVGKTTLVRSLLENESSVFYFNADNPTDRANLEGSDFEHLNNIVGDRKFIFIDEAQKVTDIGQTLKLLVDNYQYSKQIIATGSSSLNLLSNTQEPLTGRKYIHKLFPLSIREIVPDMNPLDIEKLLPVLLIYGSYPEVYLSNEQEKRRLLNEISESYLYKDILELQQIRNPASLNKLLQALALQLGSEVSISELSKLVSLDFKTVERYIDLLEKNYVIFRLPPYYTNRRKTLSKLNKIYFYDLGIRNALINNFNPLDLRNDKGPLWENFLMIERMKFRRYQYIFANQYFWRTYDGAEVNLVEERDGQLYGYEFKWSKYGRALQSWLENPGATHQTINKGNFMEFLC